jgi:hypothetical protein
MHDILDAPVGARPAAYLGIGDDALTASLASDKASEALTASLNEVEPLVLAEGAMAIRSTGSLEQG